MSSTEPGQNRVRIRRVARGLSQAELALQAGISRAAVSAIEVSRLVPSVAAALALATALECSVEELFSPKEGIARERTSRWAWGAPSERGRYWTASVGGRIHYYPAEALPLGEIPHDGCGAVASTVAIDRLAERTLVMAGCDPAAGLLARLYEQTTGYRMLVFSRSSRRALDLLHQGVVHVAGVHLGTEDQGNAAIVKDLIAQPTTLVRVASWEDGVAVGSGVSARSVRGVLGGHLSWIGREAGSGARQCLDELLSDRPAPRRLASDHRGVAEAIRCGWADAGVCLQLVAEEAGLRFFPVRTECYDICLKRESESDPRIQSLIRVIQSSDYRRLVDELPGYDARHTGEIVAVERCDQ